MRRHGVGIGLVTAAILACSFLPFLPGAYDPVAWALAFAAYVFGIVGLLLVPVGVVWLVAEVRRRRGSPARDRRLVLPVVALAATAVVGLIVTLATLPTSVALGVAMLLSGGYAVRRALSRLRQPVEPGFHPAPLYLVLVPVAVTVAQLLGHGAAVERSRNLASDNAAEMIGEIERYRAVNGRYPESLVAVWPDYRPSVVGVRSYTYEPSGAAYNLSFEQFRFTPIGTREFVVYNPRDEQTMVSHASWRMIAPELEGFYADYAAARPHWKYFWFD